MGWKLPGILQFLPSPAVRPKNQIQRTLGCLKSEARILDVGAGGRRITPNTTTLDAVAVPGVDIIGDIHCLPIESNSFDCVFCTGTLEHVADPWQAIREIYRVVKPGGVVHIDVPFIQGYHADPTDFWRFTLDGLRLLCKEFEEVESGTYIGPSCALVWVMREWANSCTSNRYLSNLFLVPVAILSAPIRYLDYLLIRCSRSHRIASAVYFRGRKPQVVSEQIPSNTEQAGQSLAATV